MPSIRFRLDPAALGSLGERVRRDYGELARVSSAEEVRVGGVGGFFARRLIEVVVEVPAGAPAGAAQAGAYPSARSSAPLGDPDPGIAAALDDSLAGLDALLAAADRQDSLVVDDPLPPPEISTEGEQFTSVLQSIRSYVPEPDPAPLPGETVVPPTISTTAGDLVVIAGLGRDGMQVAASLAASTAGVLLLAGGEVAEGQLQRVDDRRTALVARARGVQYSAAALVGFGLGQGGAGLAASVEALQALAPDQLWLAVDVSRKHGDTTAWVAAVRAALPAQALAVLHSAHTATPYSADALGLRIGWSDTVG